LFISYKIMEGKKKIIPLVLFVIIGVLWASEFFSTKEIIKIPTPNEKTKIIHKVEQKKSHANHNHGTEIGASIPKESTKIIEGNFTQPLLCANKESLIFTDAKGNQLYYQENRQSTPVILLENKSVGNNIAWSKDCNTIYFKEKTPDYKVLIKSLNIDTKKIETLENYPPLTELRSIAISDTIYFIDNKTLEVKGSIDGKEWNISKSNNKGNYYKILISPDNKYLVAHESAFIYLFKTNGEFVRTLGRGIATDWNPNGKQLIGFLDETTDGHDLSGSELYLFNIDSENPIQITFTPKAMEMWPIYKSTSEIIYTDEMNKGMFTQKLKD